jgi:hypothetical protein
VKSELGGRATQGQYDGAMNHEEIAAAALTWISVLDNVADIIREQIEERYPELREHLKKEDALEQWDEALRAAMVLAAMRESAARMESRQSCMARKCLFELYREDGDDGFKMLDAALSTEEWFEALRRDLAYGTWVLLALGECPVEISGEEDAKDAELAAAIGRAVLTTASEWWERQ